MRAGLDNWVDILILVLYFVFVFIVGILVIFVLFQIAEHLFLYVNNNGLLNSYYRSALFSVRMEEGQNHYQGLFPGRKVHAVAPGKIGLASFATKCYNFLALKNNDCFCFCQRRNCKK